MVLLSYGFTYFFEDDVMEILHIPLKHESFYLLMFFIVFAIINPTTEELFWYNIINIKGEFSL